MKKTYVFFNRRIVGIDGSIQYIYNKYRYLKDHGYDVIVFSVKTGAILVKEFEQFRPYIVPEMQYCPSMYRRSEREGICRRAAAVLADSARDELILESTSPVSAVWAELIARELHCRHVFFYLFERTDLAQDFRDSRRRGGGHSGGVCADALPLPPVYRLPAGGHLDSCPSPAD